MNKSLLSLLAALIGIPVIAQTSGTNPTPAESLDFTVDGITYTIVDEANKTCQTKAGYSYIDYNQRKLIFVYGNNKTGEVIIPATVQNPSSSDNYTVVAVGSYGFDRCTSVTISEGVTQIGEYGFLDNETLTSVTIPESVNSIGRNAFYNCKLLTNISLPSELTAIEAYTFSYTGLTSINIPKSVVYIGDNAFANCKDLENVTIPSSVLTLGKNVFNGCTGLTSLTIEEGVSSIPANCFSGCNALTTLTIPASVNSIGDYGFYCSGLTSITSLSRTIPAISSTSFSTAAYNNAKLYVYKTALSNYENSQLWGKFANIEAIEMPATSVAITPSILNINTGLTAQLTAILEPIDATGEITWALVSANPSGCIEINENGLVTARQIGTGRVSVSIDSQTAYCDVVVSANPDESVVITPPVGDIYIGDSLTLSAVVFPTTIIPNLSWSSSNPNVATIDPKTGYLKAVSDGATVITATNDNINGTIAITVKPIEASSVSLDQENISLKIGESLTLNATVNPENTTYKDVMWDTNDPSVAVVNNGVVTAVGVGTANIRAMVGQVTANCSVTVTPIEAQSITLNTTSEAVFIGQSLQLTATVNPENTTDKTITWISDNASVASVSTTGEVIAIAQGTANITAECGNVKATCSVTVNPIPSEQLVMNYSALTLKIGAAQQLTASVYPTNTTDQTITWTTSDSSVVSVKEGLVTAVGVGTATITAQNGSQTAACTIIVEPILAEQVILGLSSITINVNGTQSLQAGVLPANTTDPVLTWTSLNPEIATVTNGIVKGVSPGTTVITVACGAANASCAVTVLQPATSITLNETKLNLFVGDLYDLIETVLPANTTDVVVWASSNENVALVDNNGIITALKAGHSIITATCGTQIASCEVTVSDIPASSVSLDFTALTLKKGQSQQLSATVLPANTTNPIVTWTSSNTTVATVSQDGKITALQAGTSTITATCGDVYGSCEVTVEEATPEEIILNYNLYTLKVEEKIQLQIVNPANVAATDVTWTSSASKVAEVSSTGEVTAVAVGEATITATYKGISATCTITVIATEAETITLNYTELTLNKNEEYQLVATVYPSTVTDSTVKWISSNPEVATVDQDGIVKALSSGSTSISAVCGNAYAICVVTVNPDSTESVNDLEAIDSDGPYRVYNVQGVNILTVQSKSELNKLEPGLYIINGKKVIIR
ncbi:MAG: Ig-like domain-containing protein [Muribaculaceae bacterium]|nr:Ig-like domain-containing protein [Muribaculaceae bacterium]